MEVNTENGLGPPARWRHTGTCISDGQMLVWGGIGEKSRYNDTHVLNVEEEVAFWEGEQPDGIPPSPRSYHTATPVGRRIYFFGGYGGDGQRREVIACTSTPTPLPLIFKDTRTTEVLWNENMKLPVA